WSAALFWSADTALSPTVRRNIKLGCWTALFLLMSAISEQFDPTLQAIGVTAFGSIALFFTLAYIRFSLPKRLLIDA
ncbi:hypothetical protein, partial [Rhizobium phaseoli]|uniref:hypothetical protein n=1 Tax=Rhizobium phaseoli TaxID=396 RepID=UPI0014367821